MGTHGIKVSQEGYDVRVADDLHLLLKSNFTLLKVAFSGTLSLGSTGTWTEFTHSLGYVPQFLVYVQANFWSPSRTLLGTADFSNGVARADSTKIYVWNGGSTPTAFYYIFYEQA